MFPPGFVAGGRPAGGALPDSYISYAGNDIIVGAGAALPWQANDKTAARRGLRRCGPSGLSSAGGPRSGCRQKPSRSSRLRAILRARRTASACSRAPLLGRLLVVATKLHLPEDAFALHLLLQRTQRLVDVVVTDMDLHVLPKLLSTAGSEAGAGVCGASSFITRLFACQAEANQVRPLARRQGFDSVEDHRHGPSGAAPIADSVADPGDPEIARLAADMIETMRDAPGIGLAAPQVYRPLRLIVFEVPPAGRRRASRRRRTGRPC